MSGNISRYQKYSLWYPWISSGSFHLSYWEASDGFLKCWSVWQVPIDLSMVDLLIIMAKNASRRSRDGWDSLIAKVKIDWLFCQDLASGLIKNKSRKKAKVSQLFDVNFWPLDSEGQTISVASLVRSILTLTNSYLGALVSTCTFAKIANIS